MNELRKHILFILSVSFFILAAIQEHRNLNQHPEIKQIEIFQKSLLDQNAKLSEYLNVAELKLSDSLTSRNYISSFAELNHLFEEKGLGFGNKSEHFDAKIKIKSKEKKKSDKNLYNFIYYSPISIFL